MPHTPSSEQHKWWQREGTRLFQLTSTVVHFSLSSMYHLRIVHVIRARGGMTCLVSSFQVSLQLQEVEVVMMARVSLDGLRQHVPEEHPCWKQQESKAPATTPLLVWISRSIYIAGHCLKQDVGLGTSFEPCSQQKNQLLCPIPH